MRTLIYYLLNRMPMRNDSTIEQSQNGTSGVLNSRPKAATIDFILQFAHSCMSFDSRYTHPILAN